MDIIIKLLAAVFIAAGALIVFGSKFIVRKYHLEKDAKCGFEEEMTEEEICRYKSKRAELNVKMIGMLVLLPGMVILLVVFR